VNLGPGKLGLLWSFDYIDHRYAPVDNNVATYVRSSIGHNARVNYDFDFDGKSVELSAYCNNVFNAVRENFSYDLIASTGSQLVSYAPPRWFGASIRVSFK
jgi:iron complex outermembrane recepter protein